LKIFPHSGQEKVFCFPAAFAELVGDAIDADFLSAGLSNNPLRINFPPENCVVDEIFSGLLTPLITAVVL
jgi:hypothetical protein